MADNLRDVVLRLLVEELGSPSPSAPKPAGEALTLSSFAEQHWLKTRRQPIRSSDGKLNEALLAAVARGYHVDDQGVLWSYTGRRLRPCDAGNGYPRFTVYTTDGQRVSIKVHRLVGYQKFGDAIFGPEELRHLDSNPWNFRPDNIALGTHHENMMDMPAPQRTERAKHAASYLRSVTAESAQRIRELAASGVTYKELCRIFCVAKSTISYIVNGRTYRDVRPAAPKTTEQAA